MLLAAALLLLDHPRATAPVHRAEWLGAGDVQVRAVRMGQGDTTLVLLHGYGESLLAYRSLADRLARRFRVVALDLPGFGLSDKPAGPYDLPTTGRRVAAFLGRHTRGPLVLVGHSMGGEVAAAYALDHPERVAALALIAPAGYRLAAVQPGESLSEAYTFVAGWWELGRAYLLPLHDVAWLDEPPARATYDPATDPAYRAASMQVLRDFDFTALHERYRDLRTPVLIVWGTLDPVIPFGVGQEMADVIPCARLVPLANQLHRPHVTAPDTIAATIEAFVGSTECEDSTIRPAASR